MRQDVDRGSQWRDRGGDYSEVQGELFGLSDGFGGLGFDFCVLLSESTGRYAGVGRCGSLLILAQVAMTVNSRIIRTFLECYPNATDVPLMNGLRIQILGSVKDLPKAKKNQSAAFLAAESLLVVWDSEPMNIIPRATSIEDELMELVWNAGNLATTEDSSEQKERSDAEEPGGDEESGQAKPESRPTRIMNGVLVGITLFLVTVMLGAGFRQIAMEIKVDGRYARLAFVVLAPIQVFFTLVGLY